MGGLSVLSLLILSGLCTYAMLNHLSFAFRKPMDHRHLRLAAMCFIITGFGLSQAVLYQSHTISGYAAALKWNIACITIFFMLFPWFIAEFAGFHPRKWLMVSTFAFALMALVNAIVPYSLQFTTITELQSLHLPWGEEITLAVGHSGLLFWVCAAAVLLNLAFALWALASAWRRDHTAPSLAILIAMAILSGTAIEGILVRALYIDFIYLGPYGCLIMIIVASLALSRDTNQRLSLLDFAMDNVREAAFLNDHDGRLRYANAESCRTLGYSRKELLSLSATAIDPDLALGCLPVNWEDVRRRGFSIFESTLRCKDGRSLPVEINANFFTFAGRSYNLALARDISMRLEAEEEQKKAAQEWFTTFNCTTDLFFLIDKDGKITKANQAVSDFLQLPHERIIGRYCNKLMHGTNSPPLECPLIRLRQSRKHEEAEVYFKEKEIWMQATADPVLDEKGELVGAVHILRDITSRKRLEDQLRQAQKMEAIGTLAGGIAHDFNNILSAILGYTELCLCEVQPGGTLYDQLQEVWHAGQRAKDLVQQILAFSRRGEADLKPIETAMIVKEALKLLRSTLPATIEITAQVESSALIIGDATQVHQIIMNLCTNAAYAMRERGGVLTIRLTETRIEDPARAEVHLAPGIYQQLTVEDSGEGIAPQQLQLIFEPYFSTKPEGEGTGLGLSVVHGIVHSFGGDIRVHSKLGEGTIFDVFLPIVEEEAQPEDKEQEPRRGHERVLLVDDEPSIAMMAKLQLEKLGYRVDIRTDSRQALEMFKRHHAEFDLVISDMAMPNMPGDILAQEMMKISHKMPIIICTGFSSRISEQKAAELGIRALAMKPLTRTELGRLVRKVLDSADHHL